MSAHTPGPWITDETEHDAPHQDIRIGNPRHHTVCTVWIDDAPVHEFNAEQRANARLIAAAPDLLEALQLAYRHLNGGSDSLTPAEFDRAFKMARAAIAKATSQS